LKFGAAASFINASSAWIASRLKRWQLLDVGLSFSMITFLFASIFKIVPDVHIDWRDVRVGSLITALLFIAGKTALAYYLGRSGLESAYGAAGSMLVLLAWVY
jgi:membrane protein